MGPLTADPGTLAIEATNRVKAARALAIAADLVQIAVFPIFAPGGLSPWTRLIGWHWGFLPSFVAELVPGLDLVPTWTAAVFFATRKGAPSKIPREGSVDAEVVSSTPASEPKR